MKNVKFSIEDVKVHGKGNLAWATDSYQRRYGAIILPPRLSALSKARSLELGAPRTIRQQRPGHGGAVRRKWRHVDFRAGGRMITTDYVRREIDAA
jgi:hypothetical protein